MVLCGYEVMSYFIDYRKKISYFKASSKPVHGKTVQIFGVPFTIKHVKIIPKTKTCIMELTFEQYTLISRHSMQNEVFFNECFERLKKSLPEGHKFFKDTLAQLRNEKKIINKYTKKNDTKKNASVSDQQMAAGTAQMPTAAPPRHDDMVASNFLTTTTKTIPFYVDCRSRTIYCRGRPTSKQLLGVMFQKKTMEQLTIDSLWSIPLTFPQYDLLGRYIVCDERSLEDCFQRIKTSVSMGHRSFLDELNELRKQGLIHLRNQAKEIDVTPPADASIATATDEGVDGLFVPVPVGSVEYQSDEYLDNMDMF